MMRNRWNTALNILMGFVVLLTGAIFCGLALALWNDWPMKDINQMAAEANATFARHVRECQSTGKAEWECYAILRGR